MKKIIKTSIIIFVFLLSTLLVKGVACCANPNKEVNIFCIGGYAGTQEQCCPDFGYTAIGPQNKLDCTINYYSSTFDCAQFPKCEPGCCCDPFKPNGKVAECKQGQFYTAIDLGSQTCEQKCGVSQPGGGAGGEGTPPGGATQCTSGATQQCGTSNVGACKYGTQTCSSSGTWGSCVGNVEPTTEICGNNIDEDCSGSDLACVPTPVLPPAGPAASDPCKGTPFSITKTKTDCETQPQQNCFYDKSATAVNDCYSCNALMNCYDYKSQDACTTDKCVAGNCAWEFTYQEQGYGVCKSTAKNLCFLCPDKGTKDSSGNYVVGTYVAHNDVYDACNNLRKQKMSTSLFDCTQGSTGACSPAGTKKQCGVTNAGACRYGEQACGTNLQWGSCSNNIDPVSEVCNDNIDNDCDGSVDESCGCSSAGSTRNCGSNIGACRYGTETCSGGSWGTCTGGVNPVNEVCGDNIDNDCDNGVDESCSGCNSGSTKVCGSNVGACRQGTQSCNSGTWGDCIGATESGNEICDSLDNDCDGTADNNIPGGCASSVQACIDNDNDGYGTQGSTGCQNSGVDCDDNNAAIKPGAVDVCGNTIDEDCSGGDKAADWHCNSWGNCVNNVKTCEGGWNDRNSCGQAYSGPNTAACQSTPGPGANCVLVNVDAPQDNAAGSSVTFDATSSFNYPNPALALGGGGIVNAPTTFSAGANFGWRWSATVTTILGSYAATFTATKEGQQCTGSSGFNVVAVSGGAGCTNSNCNACSSQSACQSSNCNWCSGNICQLQACGSGGGGGTPPGTSPSACTDNDKDGYGTAGSTNCQRTGTDCDDNNAAIKPEGDEALCDKIDNNCDGISDNVPLGCPMEITLVKPRLGASNVTPFDAEIQTEREAVCKHRAFDAAFNAMHSFPSVSADKKTHTQPSYSIQSSPENFFVKCNDTSRPSNNITPAKQFTLIFDATRPVILRAYAFPEVVADVPLEARLFAETDDKTWCKYGVGKNYEELQFRFSKYNEDNASAYATVNSAELKQLQDNTRYRYNISCKNLVELTSNLVEVSFLVNTSAPAELTIVNPESGFKTANKSLKINARTNKKAICFYGNTSEPAATSGSFGSEATTHESDPVNFAHGENTIYVKCSFATAQGISIKSASSTFIVDLTSPSKPTVDDSSGFADPEVTPKNDSLTVKFKSTDAESGILYYNYTIFTLKGNSENFITSWIRTDEERVNARNLNLTNGETYFFRAVAYNGVEVAGPENNSNGIKVDKNAAPLTCANNKTDIGEADKDCGGSCAGCLEGMKCINNTDCFGNLYCNASKKCSYPTCNDKIKNQDEIGIDCGGNVCNPCGENEKCFSGLDCLSGSCETGKCTAPATCSNKKQDKDESDIDCGISCADKYNKKCEGGKKCKSNLDCISGKCNLGVCGSVEDKDNDNITNSKDNCPEDYNPKQEDSDNDKIGDKCDEDADGDGMLDECEIKFFGSMQCDDEKKCGAKADPDKDGLTNTEECGKAPFTNPLNKDTDGDGFSDKEELRKKTDPNNPNSHPSRFSFIAFLLWILLLILLVIAAVLGYKYYKKRKEEKLRPSLMQPQISVRTKPIGPVKQALKLPTAQEIMMRRKIKEEREKERAKLFGAFETKQTEAPKKKEEIQKPEKPEIPVIVQPQESLYPERKDVYEKLAEITKKKPAKPFKVMPKKTKPKLSKTKKKK